MSTDNNRNNPQADGSGAALHNVAARHRIYVPGYSTAKLGLAALGLILLGASLGKLIPLAHLAISGGSTRAQAFQIVLTDNSGQASVFTSDAAVQKAIKAIDDTRDHESTFWVEYRFTTSDGKSAQARPPLGQHMKPLQNLRDEDGLPSTIPIWYDKADPARIALPLQFGTWFMPGMLVLFGVLGLFMGLMLWWNSKRPIEMPDLSQSHGEQDID